VPVGARALEIAEKAFPADHEVIAMFSHALGDYANDAGRLAEAEAYWRRCGGTVRAGARHFLCRRPCTVGLTLGG
jgi:hypothetical protein